MLTERVLSSKVTTAVESFVFIAGIIGGLAAGFSVDRVNSPRDVLLFFAVALASAIILHNVNTTSALLAGVIIIGICSGSEMGLIAYLSTRFFGLRAFGL